MGQGRLQEAAASYGKMSTMGAYGASFAAAGLGDLALYEGRFSDAVKIFEQAAAEALKANTPDVAALKLSALAYAQLSRGQNAAAIAAADKALTNSKGLPARFLSARILVEAGAIAKAQSIAASFASELATEPQAYGKIIEGEIALKKRDLPLAIKLLTEANAVIDTWVGHFDLGRAYLEGGDRSLASADSQFDQCLKRRGEALLLVDEDPTYGYFPPVYYYLGRVREGLQTAGYADLYKEYPEDPREIDRRSAAARRSPARGRVAAITRRFVIRHQRRSAPLRDDQAKTRASRCLPARGDLPRRSQEVPVHSGADRGRAPGASPQLHGTGTTAGAAASPGVRRPPSASLGSASSQQSEDKKRAGRSNRPAPDLRRGRSTSWTS